MIRDVISAGCEQNTNKDGIEITVTIDNGAFIIDPYSTVVFFGLPPGYAPPHPVTSSDISSNSLRFQGNVNSVYSEVRVQSNDNMLIGRITVKPALPVNVYVGSYGGKGSFDLPAGTTSAPFKIPIANYGTEHEAEKASRLAKIINKSE
jgi:hypothetical protein